MDFADRLYDFNDHPEWTKEHPISIGGLPKSIEEAFKSMEDDFVGLLTKMLEEDLKKMKIYNLDYPCYKCSHQEVCHWWRQVQEVANQFNYIINENIEKTPETPHPLMFTLNMKCVHFDEIND